VRSINLRATYITYYIPSFYSWLWCIYSDGHTKFHIITMSNDNVVAKPELYYQPESEFHHQLQNECSLLWRIHAFVHFSCFSKRIWTVSKPDAMRVEFFISTLAEWQEWLKVIYFSFASFNMNQEIWTGWLDSLRVQCVLWYSKLVWYYYILRCVY
jgi:hypothetical protein